MDELMKDSGFSSEICEKIFSGIPDACMLESIYVELLKEEFFANAVEESVYKFLKVSSE